MLGAIAAADDDDGRGGFQYQPSRLRSINLLSIIILLLCYHQQRNPIALCIVSTAPFVFEASRECQGKYIFHYVKNNTFVKDIQYKIGVIKLKERNKNQG